MNRTLWMALTLHLASACAGSRDPDLLGDDVDDLADAGQTDPCEGKTGPGPECAPPLDIPPPRPRDCAPGTEWIYLIGRPTLPVEREEDWAAKLVRYEPDSGAITVVGTPSCGGLPIAPFSMAIDRDGTAWVLSAGGKNDGLFRVRTDDASCQSTSYVPDRDGFEEFGMGFAADERDGSAERLYVLGGPAGMIFEEGADVLFGTLDLETFTIETRARIPGMGELTGTGEGNLWAFLSTSGGQVITRLDPTNGARSTTYTPAIQEPLALAIAFWGGDFYVFTSSSQYEESSITRFVTRTGETIPIGPVPGLVITGAGVSTCAPYNLF